MEVGQILQRHLLFQVAIGYFEMAEGLVLEQFLKDSCPMETGTLMDLQHLHFSWYACKVLYVELWNASDLHRQLRICL